jgi:tryptophan halogenase
MIGQGIEPRHYSPLADSVPGEDIGPFLASLAKAARVRAEGMPTHRAFIESTIAKGEVGAQ